MSKWTFVRSDPAARQEIYKMFGKKTIFLAEKVETMVEVQAALAEGNTLFQGYFHARPEIIAEAQISAAKTVYLQLFAALADTPMDTGTIERLLLMEPSLCYRLLRLANSAVYGLRYRDINHSGGTEYSGRRCVSQTRHRGSRQQLVSLGVDRDADQALERAYFCESLASILNENPAELYMLGMLSMMDRMLNIPMRQLVDLVSVDSRIQEALLGSAKGMGRALELCKYEEHGGDSQGLPHPDEWCLTALPITFGR